MSATVRAPAKPAEGANAKAAEKPISFSGTAASLPPVTDHDVAQLAYLYWEARGRPFGTPLEDWLRAEQDMQMIHRKEALTSLGR